MSTSLNSLDPRFRPYATWLVNTVAPYFGATFVRVNSTRRSAADQRRLYRAYLAGRNPYPVAPPGHSAHEWGLAIDLQTEPRDVMRRMGEYWRSIGGRWGGERDPVHFDIAG